MKETTSAYLVLPHPQICHDKRVNRRLPTISFEDNATEETVYPFLEIVLLALQLKL